MMRATGQARRTPAPIAMPERPFKRWDSFDRTDRRIFFGRDHEAGILYSEILSSRLVLLYARSGTGKTSIINAAVRPMLEDVGLLTYTVRTTNDPLASIKDATREVNPQVWESARTLPLGQYFSELLLDSGAAVVLFLDQFEEFFIRFTSDVQERFINEIADVVHQPDLGVYLVFSLREDFFVEMDLFRKRIPTIYHNNSNLRLRPLDRTTARSAIVEPAALYDVKMTSDLVESILSDLASTDGRVEPIRLQLVCDALWEAAAPKRGDRIESSVYEKLGRFSGIERKAFDDALTGVLKVDTQGKLPALLSHMITAAGTKNFQEFESLREILNVEGPALDILLGELENRHLIRVSRRETSRFFELSHDSLVPQVQRWLAADRQELRETEDTLRRVHERWKEQSSLIPFGTFQEIHALRALLSFDEDQTRMMAQAAIGYGLGTTYWLARLDNANAAVDIVKGLLQRLPSADLQKNCLKALSEIRAQEAISQIVELAISGDASIRDSAGKLLLENRGRQALEELLVIVDDRKADKTRRNEAARILGQMRLAGRAIPRSHAQVYSTMIWESSDFAGPSNALGRYLRSYELVALGERESPLRGVTPQAVMQVLGFNVMALAFLRTIVLSIVPSVTVGAMVGAGLGLLILVVELVIRQLKIMLTGPHWITTLAQWPIPWAGFMAIFGLLTFGLAGVTQAWGIVGRIRKTMLALNTAPVEADSPHPLSGRFVLRSANRSGNVAPDARK